MSTIDGVLKGYRGKSGLDYHAKVHSAAPWVQDVVARSRVLKFEHLVQPDDDVLEYGVGIGLNIRHLRPRRRVGFDVSDAGAAWEHTGVEFTTELSSIEGQQFSVIICYRPANELFLVARKPIASSSHAAHAREPSAALP